MNRMTKEPFEFYIKIQKVKDYCSDHKLHCENQIADCDLYEFVNVNYDANFCEHPMEFIIENNGYDSEKGVYIDVFFVGRHLRMYNSTYFILKDIPNIVSFTDGRSRLNAIKLSLEEIDNNLKLVFQNFDAKTKFTKTYIPSIDGDSLIIPTRYTEYIGYNSIRKNLYAEANKIEEFFVSRYGYSSNQSIVYDNGTIIDHIHGGNNISYILTDGKVVRNQYYDIENTSTTDKVSSLDVENCTYAVIYIPTSRVPKTYVSRACDYDKFLNALLDNEKKIEEYNKNRLSNKLNIID
jgi:hypothetical protein